MNPLIESVNRIIYSINNVIGKIDKRTAMMIRQIFYLLIFFLTIGGIVWGWQLGREAARIKSPPIASNTSEVFDIDIKKERDEGSFGAMLESELIRESGNYSLEKPRFRSRENLEPDLDESIIEPEMDRKMKISGPDRDTPLFEGKYLPLDESEPVGRPLERRDTGGGGRVDQEREQGSSPLTKTEPLKLSDRINPRTENIDKKKGIIRDIRDTEPDPLENEAEIIVD